jgi:hypothetical protein
LKLTDVSEVRTAARTAMKTSVHVNVTTRRYILFIALMMEAVLISETSVNFNVTTRRYIPEDSKLQMLKMSTAFFNSNIHLS